MFKIPKHRQIKTDDPIIVDNYRELLFDEIPILFTGTNWKTNTVIGSSVDEDYEVGIERYFHITTDTSDYFSFLQRKVTYRSLLEKAKPIYVVDKAIADDRQVIYQIGFENIPDAYKPREKSYCPKVATVPSSSYSVSLEGGLADLNSAYPEIVGKTQNKVAKLIANAFDSLKKLIDIDLNILQKPASSGSFTINYYVEIKEEMGNLYAQHGDYFSYLNEYIKYCLNNLTGDIDKLLGSDFTKLEHFNVLANAYAKLQPSLDTEKSSRIQGDIAKELYSASKILSDLTDDIGKSYKQIAIINNPQDTRDILGIVREADKKKIEDTVLTIESKTTKLTIDEKPQKYTIYIYDLNTDTRTGHAHAQGGHPNPKKVAKPKIKILGSESLIKTKYTGSLDEGEYIDVLGKATKVDGVITNIEIEFEPEV